MWRCEWVCEWVCVNGRRGASEWECDCCGLAKHEVVVCVVNKSGIGVNGCVVLVWGMN